MPERVYNGKDGAVYRIVNAGTLAVERDLIGFFQTSEIRTTQALQEHHGPRDSAEYVRPIRLAATLTTTNFVPGAGAGPGPPAAPTDPTLHASSLHLTLPPSGWAEGDAIPGATAYQVQCDLVDGGAFVMNGYITETGESISDDPNEETLTMRSWGMPTFDPA